MAREGGGNEVGRYGAELPLRGRQLTARVSRRGGRDRQRARFSLSREEQGGRTGRKSTYSINCAGLRARLLRTCGRHQRQATVRTGCVADRRKGGELERRIPRRRFARLSSLRRRAFRPAVLCILVWFRYLGISVRRVVRMGIEHGKFVSPCRGGLVMRKDLTSHWFIDFARR